MNWWLAPGSRKNWEIALFYENCLEKLDWEKARNCLRKVSPWGLRENKPNKTMWNKIEADDGVLFYVTNPVMGVIGYGYITRKFKSREPIWSDGDYPLRFEFRTKCVVLPHNWEKKKVPLATLEKMIGKKFVPQSFTRIDKAVAEVIEILETQCEVKHNGGTHGIEVDKARVVDALQCIKKAIRQSHNEEDVKVKVSGRCIEPYILEPLGLNAQYDVSVGGKKIDAIYGNYVVVEFKAPGKSYTAKQIISYITEWSGKMGEDRSKILGLVISDKITFVEPRGSTQTTHDGPHDYDENTLKRLVELICKYNRIC